MVRKSISTARDTIERFPKEVKNFNKDMKKTLRREEERLEHEEKVKMNAGK